MSLNLQHYQGDTFKTMPLKYKLNNTPIDLTDAVIKIQLRKEPKGFVYLTLTSENNLGISITDATQGEWVINEQIIDIEPFNYLYDIKITFTNGLVKTWGGTFNFLIKSRITR